MRASPRWLLMVRVNTQTRMGMLLMQLPLAAALLELDPPNLASTHEVDEVGEAGEDCKDEETTSMWEDVEMDADTTRDKLQLDSAMACAGRDVESLLCEEQRRFTAHSDQRFQEAREALQKRVLRRCADMLAILRSADEQTLSAEAKEVLARIADPCNFATGLSHSLSEGMAVEATAHIPAGI